VVGGQHDERVALVVGQVHGDACVEVLRELDGLVRAGEIEEFGGKGEGFWGKGSGDRRWFGMGGRGIVGRGGLREAHLGCLSLAEMFLFRLKESG